MDVNTPSPSAEMFLVRHDMVRYFRMLWSSIFNLELKTSQSCDLIHSIFSVNVCANKAVCLHCNACPTKVFLQAHASQRKGLLPNNSQPFPSLADRMVDRNRRYSACTKSEFLIETIVPQAKEMKHYRHQFGPRDLIRIPFSAYNLINILKVRCASICYSRKPSIICGGREHSFPEWW